MFFLGAKNGGTPGVELGDWMDVRQEVELGSSRPE